MDQKTLEKTIEQDRYDVAQEIRQLKDDMIKVQEELEAMKESIAKHADNYRMDRNNLMYALSNSITGFGDRFISLFSRGHKNKK